MPQIFLNCLECIICYGEGIQNANVISFLNVEWHRSCFLSRSSSGDMSSSNIR